MREEAGWKVGSAAKFLELSDDEAAFVELKLGLSEALRERLLLRALLATGATRKAVATAIAPRRSRPAA